jgi:hypothetical protein
MSFLLSIVLLFILNLSSDWREAPCGAALVVQFPAILFAQLLSGDESIHRLLLSVMRQHCGKKWLSTRLMPLPGRRLPTPPCSVQGQEQGQAWIMA